MNQPLLIAPLTCQRPLPRAVSVTAVEDHVGVVAGPVRRAKLQEGFDLGLQSLQGHPTGGVVAAKSLNEVVGEEALHTVQHARRAPVQLLHLVRRQQHGLTVGTAGRKVSETCLFRSGIQQRSEDVYWVRDNKPSCLWLRQHFDFKYLANT